MNNGDIASDLRKQEVRQILDADFGGSAISGSLHPSEGCVRLPMDHVAKALQHATRSRITGGQDAKTVQQRDDSRSR